MLTLAMWRSGLLLTFTLTLLPTNTPAEAACRGLQGTFLQLTEAQASRPAGDWRQLIDELRSLAIDNLFLQWTVADRKAFFQTARSDPGQYAVAVHFGARRPCRHPRVDRVGHRYTLLGGDQAEP